ncbi:MAG: hypothetical protein LAO06_15620 [Acidobacteriia bacterium]|nr:hypothetical protein [Terriglobia bacterium]
MQGSLLRIGQSGVLTNSPGFGARFMRNFSPTLAIDSEVNFYPTDYRQYNQITAQSGGRRFTFSAGLKGGFRKQGFGLFGTVRPGLINFSRVGEIGLKTSPRTSFMTNLGGAFEIYPTKRTIVRFDVGTLLIRFSDRVINVGNTTFTATGKVDTALQLNGGVSYRLGRVEEAGAPVRRSRQKRLEVGAQFSALTLGRYNSQLRDEPGIGGRIAFQLSTQVGLEAEVNHFPRNPQALTPTEGGTITQALFGAKAGIRRHKLGLFAKVRPGFVNFGQTLANESDILNPKYSRLTHFAIDLGSVIELYLSNRVTLRFDIGDTRIYFGSRTISGPTGPFRYPSLSRDSLQMSTGFMWAF